MRKVLKSLSKTPLKHVKKIVPIVSTVLNTLDVAETTKHLAKPVIDATVERRLSDSMKIFVIQETYDDYYALAIPKTGIYEEGEHLEDLYNRFLDRLERFYKQKIISEDKSRRQAELRLMRKLKKIYDCEEPLNEHIYRIDVDKKTVKNTGHMHKRHASPLIKKIKFKRKIK